MSLEKLTTLINDNKEVEAEELAKLVWGSGFLIPEDKYKLDVKELKDKNKTLSDEWKSKYDELDLEHHNLKTSHMSDAEKAQAEIERLTKISEEAQLKINKSSAAAKLAKAGIEDEDQIENIINTYVTNDTVKSTKNLDLFLSFTSDLKNKVKEQVENDLINKNNNPKDGEDPNPPAQKTDEDIADEDIAEVWD